MWCPGHHFRRPPTQFVDGRRIEQGYGGAVGPPASGASGMVDGERAELAFHLAQIAVRSNTTT